MLLTICDDPCTHGSYAREVIQRTAKLRTFTAHESRRNTYRDEHVQTLESGMSKTVGREYR